MAEAIQPIGLAVALELSDGGGLSGTDKLFVGAAVAAAAAASPLAALAYRGKGLAVLSRLASVAAAPLAVYTLAPARFTASAIAPAAAVNESDTVLASVLSDLKGILSVYHPLNLSRLLAKNMLIQFCMKYNRYMLAVMDHEKEAIAAEAEGRDPPPPPPMPDVGPVLDAGVHAFGRELAVATMRRAYEAVAVRRLGFKRAQPFLRDSKVWIRDVLAPQHRAAPLRRRLVAYSFATAHSYSLFYAAECTVAIAQHTQRTLKRPSGSRLVYWLQGAALQVVRCTVILAAASAGAALGTLIKPGSGTVVGHLTAEVGASLVMSIVISSLLE